VRLLLVAVSIVVLALVCPGAASPVQRAPTQRVGQAGVSVTSRGWHTIRLALPPAGRRTSDPVTRIVVASARIDFGGGCNDIEYVFPGTAVGIVVLEWLRPTPGRFPPRPRRFTSTNLPVRPAPSLECFPGPGGSTQFADHGRRFDAFILLGRDAPARLANLARAVLQTLEVGRRRT
jgi:hypothetical protein